MDQAHAAAAERVDTMTPEAALERAKFQAGGSQKLSDRFAERDVKITPQAIGQWKRCPPERVLLLEEFSGVSRHLLRPDVFGEG